MFETKTHGRDVFVRPSEATWKTLSGHDGRDWIELTREQALSLSATLRSSDRDMVAHDEEDG